ncbi:MAG: ABC transporter substrate-binding protein [Alphaproteobacteria bacterium]|nr:ABC transporter substrate-binding protein [Alphaproteobacteria bacterium]
MTVIKGLAAACSLLLAVVSTEVMAKTGDPAADYIESVGNQALDAIRDKSSSKEKKQAVLEKLFKDNLDYEWVAKFVMGRFWRQATDDQKARYVPAYRDFLVRNYTSRFSEYTSGSFKVVGSRPMEKGDSLVSMEITADEPDAQPVLIDYKVRKISGGFKVFDIIVEGVSLLTTQRAEFNSVLNKSGIDGLIDQLSKK